MRLQNDQIRKQASEQCSWSQVKGKVLEGRTMQKNSNGLIPTWKKKDDHDGSERNEQLAVE